MYKKNIYRIIWILLIISQLPACHKWDDYTKYQQTGEITYPGKGDTVVVNSGNNRLRINWTLSGDPNVTKYKLYWNDRNDSIEAPVPADVIGKTLSIMVDDLVEGNYNFQLYAVDKIGNLSVANVFSGKVYGESYSSSLLNRAPAASDYLNDGLVLNWNAPDTINIATEIKYINTDDEAESVLLSPDSSRIVIANWKLGTKLYYKSFYKPNRSAIDTFYVSYYDSLIIQNVLVNKSLWKIVLMPTDVQTDAYGTSLSKIWDGSPGGYPNIYHSAGGTMPQHFTFDLGKVYTGLTAFEEVGRQDCACHNPDQFEVWGIDDITDAATILPSDDAGWEAESIAKGWTLLKSIVRTDDGIAPFKVSLPADIPPVRFIRIRVLHTVDNHASETHMSEVSFWYNP